MQMEMSLTIDEKWSMYKGEQIITAKAKQK
jgi:hypothetical protein